jgi:hypothetical protein
MKKNGSYYGYGDFRRPDSYASGDIKWLINYLL